LTRDGELKVLDFGVARLREFAPDGKSTQVGSLLGTPPFMAPEQARGRWDEVDCRTDIWAVGATLFTLLSGRFVHEAPTVQEQLIRAATVPAPSIAALVPELSPSIAEVVDRALAFDKNARWPDARSMVSALRAAAGVDSNSAPLSLPTPSAPSLSDAVTLVAPPEFSSVNTGQTYTTARPVTNPLSEARSPERSPTLWVGLALAASLVLALGASWYALRAPHTTATLEHATPAALPNPALLPQQKTVLQPEVAPTTDPAPATTIASVETPKPKLVGGAKHVKPEPKPETKHETGQGKTAPPTQPAPQQNPFDRRL
jgi:serine/threonine protein kinase